MAGNPAKLGPFVGGLNNKSRTGEARPDELVEMINFEVTTDETLTSRPPFEIVTDTIQANTLGTNWKILCIFRRSPSEWYLIVSHPSPAGTMLRVSAFLNGDLASTPTLIQADHSIENEVTDACQFADEVYFVRDISASMPGFRWSPLSGMEELTSMPRGRVIVSWKTRLWIAGRTDPSGLGAQLRYSDIKPTGPEPYTWNAADFIDIAYGEGGFITSIIPLMNNLIVFKSDGTWRFSYPAQVKDGSVDIISSSIGAATRWAALEFENVIYVYDQGNVYELVNSTFTKINKTVDILEDDLSVNGTIPGVELSTINRRIVIRYSNAIYTISLDTKTWAQWRSYNGVPSRFVELPADSGTASSPVYLSASCGTNTREETFESNFRNISDKGGTVTLSSEDSVAYIPSGEKLMFGAPFTDTEITPQSFNFPVTIGQDFEITYNDELLEGEVAGTYIPVLSVQALLPDGTSHSLAVTSSKVGTAITHTFSANPDGTTYLALRIYLENTDATPINLSNLRIKRLAGPVRTVLFKLTDEYAESAASKELIFCRIKTKSNDFGSPQSWKRLFWWGLDIKTYFETVAVAAPASKEPQVYWRELDKYTNSQLAQGTYKNPLSWLLRSISVFNRHEPEYDLSGDGRFFKKLAKALRFQRISFEYETKTHGTATTGPAKLYTITPMVRDKQTVVDTNT